MIMNNKNERSDRDKLLEWSLGDLAGHSKTLMSRYFLFNFHYWKLRYNANNVFLLVLLIDYNNYFNY